VLLPDCLNGSTLYRCPRILDEKPPRGSFAREFRDTLVRKAQKRGPLHRIVPIGRNKMRQTVTNHVLRGASIL